MVKEYKISYKVYSNERLNKVNFHSKLVYPLYIQITFNRKSSFFKSYYFNLASKSKYTIEAGGHTYGPNEEDIIAKEVELIEFIIERNAGAFSLEHFKAEYDYYCRDLYDLLEPRFINYMVTFFQDKGATALAEIIRTGTTNTILHDLISDLRHTLNTRLYQNMVDNSFAFSPSFLPISIFNETNRRTQFKVFPVMVWQQQETQEKFRSFFYNHFASYEIGLVYDELSMLIDKLHDK